MAFYCQSTCLTLHREVISDCSGAITDEIEGLGEATSWKEVMEKVVKGSLRVCLNVTSSGKIRQENHFENDWRPKIGR